ncbi:hypothetical protein BH10ACI1_BH10ACI1_22450 [soil metagenome]
MKFCPVCQTRYDEEILRFCIKDGAPLVDDTEPNFTEMPSKSVEAEDFGDETVISRKPTKTALDAIKTSEKTDQSEPARIVIPTAEQERQQVRTRTTSYQPPLQKSNTPMVILTTVVLTLVGLAALGGIIWVLNGGNGNSNQNINVNTNPPDNMNLNTNFGVNVAPTNFDYNVNSNANFNSNYNFNLNTNANVKSPTPTKTPTPTPSPLPSSPSPTSTAEMSTPTPVKTATPDTTKTPMTTPTKTPENK